MLAVGEEIPKIEMYFIFKREDNDYHLHFFTPASYYYILSAGARHDQQAAPERAFRHDHNYHLLYVVHVRSKTNYVELWYPSLLLGNLLSPMRESPITEVVAPIDFHHQIGVLLCSE